VRYLPCVRIYAAAVAVLVMACASSKPNQSLKTENKRLRSELADARRQQAETDEKLKALQAQIAQLDLATKAKDGEIAKLRTDSSDSWKQLAEARGKTGATDKKPLSVQCPIGTVLDPTATACVPAPAPPPPPPVPVAPPPPLPPVVARVIKIAVDDDHVVVVVATGTDAGVAKTWRAQVLRGTTTAPLVGGKGEVMRVDKRTTTIKLRMTRDAIADNPTVQLSPP